MNEEQSVITIMICDETPKHELELSWHMPLQDEQQAYIREAVAILDVWGRIDINPQSIVVWGVTHRSMTDLAQVKDVLIRTLVQVLHAERSVVIHDYSYQSA